MRRIVLAAALLLVCVPAKAAFETGDLICESTATTGTGTVNLAGAITNYVTFVSQLTSGSQVPYHIISGDGKLETGYGVFTDAAPDTLSRVATWSTDGSGAELTLSGTSTACVGPLSQMFFDGAGLSTPATSLSFQVDSDGTPLTALTLNEASDIDAATSDTFRYGGAAFPWFTLENTNNAADGGVSIAFYNNSATPAAFDFLGGFGLYGKDSGGNIENFGYMQGYVSDPTNASEDGYFEFGTMTAGTAATQLIFSNGVSIGSTDLAPGAGNLAVSGTYVGTTATMDLDATPIGGNGPDFVINPSSDAYFGIESSSSAAVGPTLITDQYSSSAAANDQISGWFSYGNNTTPANVLYGRQKFLIKDATAGTEDAAYVFQPIVAGSLAVDQLYISNGVTIGSTDLAPGTGNLAVSGTYVGTTTTLDMDATPIGFNGPLITTNPSTTGVVEIDNANAGANGLLMLYYHNSASPAANDQIANNLYYGRNTTPATFEYARWRLDLLDPTAGSEDTEFVFQPGVAGTLTDQMFVSNGVSIGTANGNPGTGNLYFGGSGVIEFNGGTSTTLADNGNGELTLEGKALKRAGKQMMYIPASAMKSNVTSPASCGDTYDSGSNDVTVTVCAFDTGATEERADFQFQMPKAWDESTITYQVLWTNTAGASSSVAWEVGCAAVGDQETLNTAMGSTVIVTDAWAATNNLATTAESAALTIGNSPAENDWIACRINRDTSNGSDAMAGDALLVGIKIFWTDNASTLAE